MKIAIVSPSQNSYSETFIQAHKNLIKGKIYYYYGNMVPIFLEGEGRLTGNSNWLNYFNKIIYSLSKEYNDYLEVAFAKSLQKKGIEVVLAEYGTTGASITQICKNLDIPLFVFFHGSDASRKSILEAYKKRYTQMFNFATTIFVVSNAMQNQLQTLGCKPEKLILNTYGPDNEFYKVEPEFKKKKIFSVGRFVDKKAPYFVILAFLSVLNKHPDAELFMAGGGELLNTCVNLVKYYNIENKVNFTGKLTPIELREHLSETSIFVQHSLTANDGDSEGTPVAILEAQAAGIPVVSTLHAGIPDVVINGFTGFLVNEGDVDGMSEKISLLLSDMSLAATMGSNGRKRIKENFNLQNHIHIIESCLAKALNK